MSDFRETLYTISKEGHRKWVYADVVCGYFYRRRQVVVYILMAFYLIMPWIKINGEQGIFLDILHRRFVVFGEVFWATDTRFLVMVLGGLGFSLFFFTAMLGRVWCGWACPETVFLEFLFRPIESLIEGSPAQRKRLDKAPWTFEKFMKKGIKYLIFGVLCWLIASTFLAYFVGAQPLLRMMSHSPIENPTEFFVTLFIMGIMLFQFGWFREQFCTVLCPYARFQSVLLDSNSLLIGYDRSRGEPRGKLKHNEERKSGDCIDCGLCVRVCPTGIDIRNGLQLECVQCAECIDACNSIMSSIDRPPGLIRYDTEYGLMGKKTRLVRPRVVLYAVVLLVYLGTFTYLLMTRELSECQIIRSKGVAPFSVISQDKISNAFHVHISNKSPKQRFYQVQYQGSEAVEVVIPISPYPVPANGSADVPLFFNFPPQTLRAGKLPIEVTVRDDAGFQVTQPITLLGPE